MWARQEQQDMVETMRAAGPDAPTLCDGWRTRHLAAHLYLRGHRPWELIRGAERAIANLGDRCADLLAYDRLLTDFAAPARGLSGVSGLRRISARVDDATNLLEYVVHHEDVRRAAENAAPRELEPTLVEAVWQRARVMARLTYRSAPVGVILVVPGGPRVRVRRDSDSVAVVGDPIEQALYAFGRRTQAEVTLLGAPDAVARLRDWAGTSAGE
ncbi:TIGR03085 family metal-binding protein [Ruania halotolerans]|uniref:TIGR03085 family metal-binding protein n=1 Tax=Ruania halotolerans TaxID=2897773 RepID=UPI001E357F03|nr:TIGR03085 family metal-binding protein [Ruania halotolerans]UFU08085.1 TIGR03085 family metal-binding protein [Ruania halotolerans]